MRGVLVAAAICLAAASVAAHPALAGAAVGPGSMAGAAVHEDLSAGPGHSCRRARTIRSVRFDHQMAGAGQPLLRAPTGRGLLAIDDEQAALERAPARPGLVSSVTRAPRAPPRS